jgi:transposase
MQAVTTIGLDIAKSVFQVHGVNADGNVVLRRQLKRRYVLAFFQKLPPCLIGIEACASPHYWSRELQALGHTVRLTGAGDCSGRKRCSSQGVSIGTRLLSLDRAGAEAELERGQRQAW